MERELVTIPRTLYDEVLAKLRAMAAHQDAQHEARLLREQVDALYQMDAVERGMVFFNPNHDPHNGQFTTGGAGGTAEASREATGRGRSGRQGGTTRQRAPRQSGQSNAGQSRSSGTGSGRTRNSSGSGSTSGSRSRASRNAATSARTQTPAERELEAALHEHEVAKQEFEHATKAERDALEVRDRANLEAGAHGKTFQAAREDLRQQELTRAATRAPRSYERMQEQRQKAVELRSQANELRDRYMAVNQRVSDLETDLYERQGLSLEALFAHPDHQAASQELHSVESEWRRVDTKARVAESNARTSEDRLIGNRVTRDAIDAHPLMQQAQQEFEVARAAHEAAMDRSLKAGQRVDAAEGRVRQARGALDLERGGPGIESEVDADGEKSWRGVFGRDFSTSDLAKLSGAGRGDRVSVSADGNRALAVSVDGHITRSFTVSRTGSVITLVDGFTGNEGAKTSSSGADLIRGMENMRELGVTRIQCTAARSDKMNGYYTWAKLGFTGKIPEGLRSKVHAEFGSRVNRIEQLMSTRAGANWWKQHGDSWGATFDFRNSYSMGRLNDFKRILSRHQNSGEGA